MWRRRRWAVLLTIPMTLALTACATMRPPRPAADADRTSRIIPRPVRAERRPGGFVISAATKIVILEGRVDVLPVAEYIREFLKRPTGTDLRVEVLTEIAGDTPLRPGALVLRIADLGERLGEEGYRLEVAADRILIQAASANGLFYGFQTLRQLMPPEVEGGPPVVRPARWSIPGVSIEDRPRFAWRGALLDCSRHFFPKEFLKRWVDILAMHKLNTFHWHLTDDQGWRVEIKGFPRLTGVGAWRVDREDKPWNAREPQNPGEAATYGGFYTQDDIREIVAYARSRFVTIIPEIEMPGHAKAALAAYPEYSCTGGPFTVPPGGYWPITDVLCPGNDGTFSLLEGVLDEVAGLFPGIYVHIGGDEVDKTEWKRCPKCQARMRAEGLKDENELQSWFVRRIEAHLHARGRSLVGWDEILEGGLAPRAAVMSWRGTEGGIAAAREGHDVIMTPTSHCYFDYYQGNASYEPLAIGGDLPLRTVYSFEPVPEALTEAEAGHVLGGQANLWTEYISDGKHAEYMLLPRLAALAEAVWSTKGGRDWAGFCGRLLGFIPRYEQAGLNSARSGFLPAIRPASDPKTKRISARLETEIPGLDIRYTTDGSEPTASSRRSTKPIVIKRTVEVRAASYLSGRRMSVAAASQPFLVHAAAGRIPVLGSPFSRKFSGGGEAALVDGLLGSKNINDGRWQGFEGSDLDAVIDLGSSRFLRRVSLNALQKINSWVFLPVSVEFAVSPDGRDYETVATMTNEVSPRLSDVVLKEFATPLNGRRARFLRARARNVGTVPEWHSGAGGKAWLFVDEIIVDEGLNRASSGIGKR